MTSLSKLLDNKGRHVHTVSPQTPVVGCATLMAENSVGSLVVVDDGKPVGIVTRNDIVQIVAKKPAILEKTPVSEIMSTRLATTSSSANALKIRDEMVAKKIRHMPVVDEGKLIGLISLADVLFLEVDEAHLLNEQIKEYLSAPYF